MLNINKMNKHQIKLCGVTVVDETCLLRKAQKKTSCDRQETDTNESKQAK